MTLELIITAATLIAVLVVLVLELVGADIVLLAALGVVIATGVIPLDRGLEGFASPTLLALGSLYVVSAALRGTGALALAGRYLLGKTQKIQRLLLRTVVPVSIGSAFLNNTPIVAMGIPAIQTWCADHDIAPSRLLMPMSFASIVGGMCTLMGTSTNLVSHGLLQSHGLEGLGFFELAVVGIPCTLVAWVYLVFATPLLLREREPVGGPADEEKTGLVEMEIVEDAEISGATVESTSLASIPGFELDRIERDDEVIAPVEGDEAVERGDHFFFRPTKEHGAYMPDTTRHPGVKLAVSQVEDLADTDPGREHHTVVVREGSRLAGERLGDTEFLRRFDAVISEIRRDGEEIEGPLRDIVLKPGDTLVLDTGVGFRTAFEDAPDFYVTSGYEEGEQEAAGTQQTRERVQMWATVAVVVAIATVSALGVVHIAVAALIGAVAVIIGGVISASAARDAIDWSVMLVIGASLGLGEAMQASGAADVVADALLILGPQMGPLALLAGIVIGTSLLTNLITNNGAVALFFPVAISVAATAGVDARPLVIGLTVAGSMALVTPLAYQTNLMVYSAGNYKFLDFARLGLPLQILLIVVTVIVVPLFWSF